METAPKTSLKTFFPYLLIFRWRIFFVLLIMIFAKVAAVTAPWFLKSIVDFLQANPGHLELWQGLLVIIAVYLLVRLVGVVFSELKDLFFSKVETQVVKQVSNDVFHHVHTLSLAFHLGKKTGTVSTKIDRGLRGIEFIFRLILFTIVPTIIEIMLVIGVLMVNYHWSFTVVTLATLAVYIFFTIGLTEARNKVNRELNMYNNEAQGRAIDSLLNFETVKYFTNEAHEEKRYDESLSKVAAASLKSKYFLYSLNIGQGVIITLGVVALILLASFNVLGNQMTLGDFTLVTVYIAQLSIPLGFLGFVYRQVKESFINMEDMFALLNIESDIKDTSDAEALKEFEQTLQFRDVFFSYNPDREILHGVSFTVQKGKTLALVGPSGSGKSSIARLLFRFYDVQKGIITIDGHDIRHVTQKSLRSLIGFVPQDTVLFNDTIYYNIAYGHPHATKEEIYEAAKKAHIHEFILSLPQGYETTVGERGLKLSGGEKQRVAIARVILKKAPILVFDEATSSLDSQSEQAIQEAILELSRERTMLIIAHRLSTIVHADSIIVLEKGHVKEEGNHGELLKKKGLYATLWDLQQKE